jgi:hypothetical protein
VREEKAPRASEATNPTAAKWIIQAAHVLMKGLDCCEDANFGSHQAGKWLGANVAIEKADDDRHDAVAELWTQLNHPNILKLYGTCCVDNRVFFVCESVDSDKWDDLREHLLGRPTEVWGKLYQVALGVLYLRGARWKAKAGWSTPVRKGRTASESSSSELS